MEQGSRKGREEGEGCDAVANGAEITGRKFYMEIKWKSEESYKNVNLRGIGSPLDPSEKDQ